MKFNPLLQEKEREGEEGKEEKGKRERKGKKERRWEGEDGKTYLKIQRKKEI